MNNYICTAYEFEPIVSNATIADSIARFNPGDVFQVRFLHEKDMQKMRSNGRYMTFAFLTTPENKRRSTFFALSFDRLIICKIYVIELPESQISRNHRDDKQFCYDIYT